MTKIKTLLKRLADWYNLEKRRLQIKDDGLVDR
nr:MAG TPA: hypothetical protein [Caudoviricetes sp.]